MQNVREKMDIFFDHKAPSIVIDLDEYRNGYIDIRRTVGARIAHSTKNDLFEQSKDEILDRFLLSQILLLLCERPAPLYYC